MIEHQLREETMKWLERVKKERKNIRATNEQSEDFLKNIDAYIEDTEHFMQKDDLIRAFEAVVWAWSWLEICKELGIIKSE